MINFKKLENISAIAIVAAFFLPWVSLGFMSFSGYDLPNAWHTITSFTNALSETKSTSADINYAYASYLVPLLSLGLLLLEFLGKPSRTYSIVVGALNIIGFLYHLIFRSGGELGFYGVGLWITVLASLLMLLCALGVIRTSDEKV
jgi:hypothetical protein